MVEIISDVGFCFGIRHAVSLMKKCSENGLSVFLSHPLMHNESENQKLMKECKARYITPKTLPGPKNCLVFSAHGHDPKDEKAYEGFTQCDAICPLIVSRYKEIAKIDEGITKFFIGKRNHQETIGFLTHFPSLFFIDVEADYEKALSSLDIASKSVVIPQTTISKSKYDSFVSILQSKTKIVKLFPLCQNYANRLTQSIDYLKEKDLRLAYVIVVGDQKSSNANEILKGIQDAFPGLEAGIGMNVEDFPVDFSKLKSVYLTSATSCSEASVRELKSNLEVRFKNLG